MSMPPLEIKNPVSASVWYCYILQGDQINMVVLFSNLAKSVITVYNTVQVYTGQETFNKVPETHGHV